MQIFDFWEKSVNQKCDLSGHPGQNVNTPVSPSRYKFNNKPNAAVFAINLRSFHKLFKAQSNHRFTVFFLLLKINCYANDPPPNYNNYPRLTVIYVYMHFHVLFFFAAPTSPGLEQSYTSNVE